jgi:tetratricopeptide (TPR) repeat protein
MSRALQELGAYWKLEGQTFVAEGCLKDALKKNPKLGPAMVNLAWIYADQGKLDEAIVEVKKCTELCPEYVGGWQDLGVMWSKKGRMIDAQVAFEKCYQLQPSHQIANQIGLCATADKSHFNALKWFDKALNTAPGYVPYCWNKAMTLKALGRNEEADKYAAVSNLQNVQLTTEMIRPDFGG